MGETATQQPAQSIAANTPFSNPLKTGHRGEAVNDVVLVIHDLTNSLQ